jgi:hypothetical protein
MNRSTERAIWIAVVVVLLLLVVVPSTGMWRMCQQMGGGMSDGMMQHNERPNAEGR